MLTDLEVREVAKEIVQEAKDTAHVEQGRLKRSIAYTLKKGEVVFRELYYGQWNDNSKLEDIATKKMPYGIKWRIVYTELGGDEYEVSKTKSGRRSIKSVKKSISKKVSTDKINALITSIKKKNGKKKNERPD